jgi:hypothetical protein
MRDIRKVMLAELQNIIDDKRTGDFVRDQAQKRIQVISGLLPESVLTPMSGVDYE